MGRVMGTTQTPHSNPAYPARGVVEDTETHVAQMARALGFVHSYKWDPALEHQRRVFDAVVARSFVERGVTDPAVVFIAEGMAWDEALEMCELIGVPTALAG